MMRRISGLGLYFAFLIPPLIIGLVVQARLKRVVSENSQIAVASGLTGAQVARAILDQNGLHDVPVQAAKGGALSDHYDPRSRTVNLSEAVFDQRSLAATAIGAHEVGHAIQHAKAYTPMQVRSALFPVVAFASNAWLFLLFIGAFANALGLVTFALILYAAVVLFQFVTLPVELNASSRAGVQLANLGLVTSGEQRGVKQVLGAAAWTYVAGALAALTQLLYFLLIFFGGRR